MEVEEEEEEKERWRLRWRVSVLRACLSLLDLGNGVKGEWDLGGEAGMTDFD